MKNLLIFPPYWCCSHPYLSLPCLTAFLKKENIEIDQIDINVECIYYFLSSNFILKCKDMLSNKTYTNEKIVLKDIMLCDYICNNIDLALDILKNKNKFYNIEEYKFAKEIIEYAFEIISKTYYPTHINLKYVKFSEKMNLKEITSTIINKNINPFIEFYENYIDTLNLESRTFIGISLVGFEQLIPSLTLCNIIKKKYPKIHISLGGSLLSKLVSRLDNLSQIFDYIDSILVFEGEYPLLKLIQAINNHDSLNCVPNLIYIDRQNKKVLRNKINKITNINDLPVPDFQGLQLDKYLSCEKILPYYISRSCYWGKCTFCDHDYAYDGKYRVKNINVVVKELAYLKKKYDVEYFHIIDEALPPRIVDILCDEIINQGLKIKWFNYIRADSNFTDELCEKMKKCGCIQIMIGVESCSDKVLESMNKGITLKDIEFTLKNMNKNEIWNHVFLINDFPTETVKDKFFTVKYILSNKYLFHSIGVGNFTLGINSKIMKDLKQYNISKILNISDFSCIYGYELNNQDECDNIFSYNIESIISDNIESSYFFNRILIFREHLPLYLEKHKILQNRNILYDFNYDKKIHDEKIYFLKNTLYCKYKENLIIYNLKSHKEFIVTLNFKRVLDFFAYAHRSINDVVKFFNENFTLAQQCTILDFLNKNSLLNNNINKNFINL